MKRNFVRVGILSVLILLGIGQTMMLWLGNMPSHNFFRQNGTSVEQYYVYPKYIWINKNGSAYKLEGYNTEESQHYRLIEELFNALKKEKIDIVENTKVSYTELLSSQGIVYEYGMPLRLSELLGKGIKLNNKEITDRFKNIFVDVSTHENYKTYIYLITEEDEVKYCITVNDKLPDQYKLMSYFVNNEYEEELSNYKSYHASLLDNNMGDFLKNNIFYPLGNQEVPVSYQMLKFQPVVTKGDEQHLEGYVNDLFKNPIYKQKTTTESAIIFNDNLNINVQYEYNGTLEFTRVLTGDEEKNDAINRMDLVCTFIKETEAIPEFLKEGIYLSDIRTDQGGGEVTYYFDYQYDGFDILLTKEVKEKLGVEAYVQLTIKDGIIVHGKWLMIQPQVVFNNTPEDLTTEFYESSSELKENLEPGVQLENMACAYIFRNKDEVLEFKWVGYDEQYLYIVE